MITICSQSSRLYPHFARASLTLKYASVKDSRKLTSQVGRNSLGVPGLSVRSCKVLKDVLRDYQPTWRIRSRMSPL